jgi:hypothetical protein
MRGNPETLQPEASDESDDTPIRPRNGILRRVTQLPIFGGSARSDRTYGAGQNDGVFANLSAKPTRGEDLEEKPPVCELISPTTPKV